MIVDALSCLSIKGWIFLAESKKYMLYKLYDRHRMCYNAQHTDFYNTLGLRRRRDSGVLSLHRRKKDRI